MLLLDVAGKFYNNLAKDWGSIVSVQGLKKNGGKTLGRIHIHGSQSIFENNKAENDKNLEIMWINQLSKKENREANERILKGKDFKFRGKF